MELRDRFIKSNFLPAGLWCVDTEEIMLPASLVNSWEALLNDNALFGLASQTSPKGFHGGMTKEDTDKHLAWRYSGSCARVVLSILDPKNQLPQVSDAYASIFAGGKVFIADIPCGSGAATISILCTLYELRKSNLLPRHPLEITVVAGEISTTARGYFCKQIEGLRGLLEQQSIWIDFEILHWDALDKVSTVDLIRRMTLQSNGCSARLLMLTNFTGFLESSGNWKRAKGQFDDIFLHSRDSLSTAIWIEPQRKNVRTFFGRAVAWLKNSFRGRIGDKAVHDEADWYAKTESKCKHPIKELSFRVRLTVMRFDLLLGTNE